MRTRLHRTGILAALSGLATMFLLFLVGVPSASAATATWFNGVASYNVSYTEGTVYQSRTGIVAGFTENNAAGSLRIYVWFGPAYNICWANTCDQYDSRSYKKGKFKFNGYAEPGDTIDMKSYADNVGPLHFASSENEVDGTPSTDVTSRLSAVANSKGISPSELVRIAENDGADIYVARSNESVYLIVANGPSIAVAEASAEAFEHEALTIATNVKDDREVRVNRQYVLVPDNVDGLLGDAASEAGLKRIGDGLYSDTEFEHRRSDLNYAVRGKGDIRAVSAASAEADFSFHLSASPEFS